MGTQVTGVQNTADVFSTAEANAGTGISSLSDQFMTILLTQLRYQDPLEPMQEKDFFAQMAQFTAASETESMSKNLSSWMASLTNFLVQQEILSASNLIGRAFTAQVAGETLQGIVESCGISDGKVFVYSGGQKIPLECLTSIGGKESGDSHI